MEEEQERFVEIMDQGRLAGILHLPSNMDHPCPVVIYCPGKNGERYEVHRLAVKLGRVLAQCGIAFLRFDYYGIGLSDGSYHQMTTSTKVSNVKKAFEYLQNIDEVDTTRTTLLGFSDGARIALMVANEMSLSNLVLWSPLFYEFGGNYPGNRKPRFERLPKHPNNLVMPWAGLWVSMDFYRDLFNIDIDKELRAFTGESLLIFGEEDPLIQEEFEIINTFSLPVYSNSEAHKVVSVPEAGHLFTSVKLESKLMMETVGWLLSSEGDKRHVATSATRTGEEHDRNYSGA
ncbi:alpha/beta hydrolase [Paenibacillus kobensis]|uniref:alpha/beta hydrolase n=1 Tax=Paenibacillus kobensis TaxID=59841 RepID=UPI000FD83B93|nr:alpha/beta hydrolase [Paenibacillus kobensis]